MVNDLFPVTLAGARSSRRGTVLVGPIDLTLEGSGTCVVIGPNGSGKTSFLRMLHGAARLTGGTIDWACPLTEARRQQAFVFQRPVMLRRTVEQNLIFPLIIHGTSRRAAKALAREWAEKVALDGMLDRQASILSGGEQQKLALARALISEPRLIFLDEPCSALDGRATREIEEILLSAKASGTRLIMSTHDMGQARRLADEVVFLMNGKVNAVGEAPEFFDRPGTSQAQAFLNGDIVE